MDMVDMDMVDMMDMDMVDMVNMGEHGYGGHGHGGLGLVSSQYLVWIKYFISGSNCEHQRRGIGGGGRYWERSGGEPQRQL